MRALCPLLSTDSQFCALNLYELALMATLGDCPFEEGAGRVHRGFYHAAKCLYGRVTACLNNGFGGHKVLMCGHGVSGAIALILGQMLRHRDVQLYTYGAPRAGDAAFVRAAQSLAHYRMVHHHDPLPSLPGSWMSTRLSTYHGHATHSTNTSRHH